MGMIPPKNTWEIFRSTLLVVPAVVLFVPLFFLRRLGPVDFWWWMSFNIGAVITLSLLSDRSYPALLKKDLKSGLPRKIILGLFSAFLLYAVFYAGNELSQIIFSFAEKDISRVYSFKQGAATWRIAVLMVFIIGPGEEIFWRGFLQRKWTEKFGSLPGLMMAMFFYAGIHISSGNIMLVLAAAVCGLFWGVLYLRYRSVIMIIISHTIWDLLIFLAFPL
jgi:membrane protease YdiL (CAAX protease family)